MANTSSSRPAFRAAPPEMVALFEKVMLAFPDAQVKKTFGYPSAYVNGQMFSGLHNESMILKLPPGDLKTILALDGAHAFEPMPGRPMKEFAVVPPSLLHSEPELVEWLHKAFTYVGSLPPKPPKKSKKKA